MVRRSLVLSIRRLARYCAKHEMAEMMNTGMETPDRTKALATTASGPAGAEKRRVYIVDDHTMFREGLRQLIEREAGLTVCGDAPDAAEALRGIRTAKPDVVIVDISLAGTSGLDLIKAIKAEFEDLPVLVVSMHDESLYAERALRSGAMGYVMKHEPAKTVKAAIQKVLGGDMYLSEKMSTSVINRLMRGQSEPSKSPIATLSDRELEVFRLLGQGKGVRLIGEELGVTIPTVNSFRNRIKEKLQLKSSTEVMLHAIQWVRDDSTK
jgi:DNA-binding NarL/FixJ family response regulator